MSIDEEAVCDILDQQFEVVTEDLTVIEKKFTKSKMKIMEVGKYYGFNFFGEGNETKLVQTYLPVGQPALEDLLYSVKGYVHHVKFKVLFGTIKELTLFDDVVTGNAASKAGKDKFQAFILKRKNDEVTGEGDDYFVNGKKLDLGFSLYDVSVVEFNE